ncbi:MAG TPA: D-alanyl-D-alanine carboxypeptidase/D-alanyl-D-alanine-endopeptidase [Candidatus Eremiobacteraceae bacterium]
MNRYIVAIVLLAAIAAVTEPAAASPGGNARVRAAAGANLTSFASRIDSIAARPAFAHARIGVEFFDLDANRPIFSRNGAELFVAASTTKLVTEAATLHALGPTFRFHTRVYRTGPVDSNGVLQGQLVVVPSGDPNLSGRTLANGTYAFNDEDHSYGGAPVQGDPLAAVEDLASQIAAHGVKSVTGDVIVQMGLFKQGDVEGGTGMVISPVCLNDNIVDISVNPGSAPGSPAAIAVSPATSYLTVVNKAVTGTSSSANTIDESADAANPNGTHTLTITGSVPAGAKTSWTPYGVPQPDQYLRFALTDALRSRGVSVLNGIDKLSGGSSFAVYSASDRFADEDLVGDHTSLPLAQDVRITLKVSQNLHAATMPYLLGALVTGAHTDSDRAGFGIERAWLAQAGLDLGGAAQSDGEGSNAYFSPDFMVHLLAYERRQPEFWAFHAGLPLLGRDGTLAGIARTTPAAGHVVAKTGTWEEEDYLNRRWMVRAKGLAGYFTSRSGRHIAFAVYLNDLTVPTADDVTNIAGQTCGEVAALGYQYL